MPPIFRETPPLEIVEEIVKAFMLLNLQDSTWFSKSSVQLSILEPLLPQLEPYYIPCKAKEFLHSPLTQSKAITILRQLCKAHSIPLTSAERTCAGVKGTWYRITPTEPKVIMIDFQ